MHNIVFFIYFSSTLVIDMKKHSIDFKNNLNSNYFYDQQYFVV